MKSVRYNGKVCPIVKLTEYDVTLKIPHAEKLGIPPYHVVDVGQFSSKIQSQFKKNLK